MTDMTDEMLTLLTDQDRTLYAIRQKMYALGEAIDEAIELGQDASVAHLRSRRRVLRDRRDAAQDAKRVITAATLEEAMAIRDAVANLDRMVTENAAISDILATATTIAAMAAGEVRVPA